ncbi:MAG: sigma-70 family RNA polymerase sigma factor [Rubrivivax sp.]|nr:sigma-70 family RNA polymerase sigma factor [Rubrivivax sp.]
MPTALAHPLAHDARDAHDASGPAGAVPGTVGWADMAPHRGYLVAYARRRLLDPALAEDLVHDVFEAVMTGRAAFGGRSALRSWLVAILKHKIVDLIRQRSGHISLDAGGDDDEGEGSSPAQTLACPQPRPDEVAEQRQRLAHTMARIQALPDTLRHVVQRRLLRDESTEAVCRALAITEQNLFVRLHRARRLLAS